MRINTNTAAMNTYSNLTSANASKSSSLAKLSSGLRINKAGDDAAGLAISEKMKNQISGMTQASRNAQDGISLIQTAEGALGETHSILNRMRDLTVQAANGTNTDDDKTAIQSELTSLTKEIDRIAGDTEFNTQGLMNATEGINVDSIDASGVSEETLKTAYNGLIDDDADDATTKGDLATKLSKLSKEDLEKVVNSYNKLEVARIKGEAPIQNKLDSNADIGSVTEGVFTPATIPNNDTAGILAVYNEGKTEGDETYAKNFSDMKFADDTELSALKVKYNTVEKSVYEKKLAEHTKELSNAAIKSTDIKAASSKEFTFQIGANAGEKISVEIKNMSTKGLGISDINVTDADADTDAILDTLDDAISLVSEQRADLGAVQNRLDHTVSNLATTKENLSEANSRITDVDMAEEMMSFTKSNILSQASTSMLAQANQMPQSVLSLLQ